MSENFGNESVRTELTQPIMIDPVRLTDNYLAQNDWRVHENSNVSLIFDGEIPLNGEMELIEYIYNELNSMNIFNIVNEEIVIFDDLAINTAFLEALQYVIELSVKNENFFNDSTLF